MTEDRYDFTHEDQIGPLAERTPYGTAEAVQQIASAVENEVPPEEKTRRWLAGALVGLFAFVAVASLLAVIFGVPPDDLKELLDSLVPPIVALTGSVVGFYFGVERGRSG